MAISTIQDLIRTHLLTIGFTIVDHHTLNRLLLNGGGTSLPGGFDKARLVLALINAKTQFFHAWIGEAPQPRLVAAWSARDLARRIEYLVGEPVLVKSVDTDDVRQSIAPQPETPQPDQQAGHKPEHVRVREAREAKRVREEAEAAVRCAQNGLEQIKAEPRPLSARELQERRPEIEARIRRQEQVLRQAEAKLKAILERQDSGILSFRSP